MNNMIDKAMVTLAEMMDDRKNPDLALFVRSYTPDKIKAIASFNQVFTLDMDQQLRIIFHIAYRFKIADIRKYFDNPIFDSYIVIVREKITTVNIKTINEINKDIQIFEMKELQFNITKHVMVPKHELINNESDIADIVTRFNIKSKSQLPFILKTDPVARYMNAKPGNVVKIIRFSPTSGEYILYRCCV